jgi:hypothetical protein
MQRSRRGDAPSAALRELSQARENPDPPASGTSELKTKRSAFAEEYEACSGQHLLLPSRQAAAGLPSRQVADYLNDLDQIP